MRILLNGQELHGIADTTATLGVALSAVQEQFIDDDQVIANINVDGEPLTAERLAAWKGRPVGDFSEAHIEALKRKQLAAHGLRLMAQGLADSITDRNQITDHLRQGRSDQAMPLLNGYLQVWYTAQQTIAGVARLLEINLDTVEVYSPCSSAETNAPQPLSQRIATLTEQLSQLKAALQAGDFVLLGDILDYEFDDLSEAWVEMFEQLATRAEDS